MDAQYTTVSFRAFVITFLVCSALAAAAVIFVAAGGASDSFATNYIDPQDELFLALNRGTSKLPALWFNLTEFGDALILIPVFSFFIFMRIKIWAALFGAVPLSTILARGGKELANVPRPAAVLPHDQMNIVGEALSSRTSLPSGHTLTVFAIVTVVVVGLMLSQRKVGSRIILFSVGMVFAAAVGFSRVAVGAHWPVDVIVGALLGIAGGLSGVYMRIVFQVGGTG